MVYFIIGGVPMEAIVSCIELRDRRMAIVRRLRDGTIDLRDSAKASC